MTSNRHSGFESAPHEPVVRAAPSARFLSNGNYSLLITARGTGLSTAGGRALTRWCADRVQDPPGFAIFIRDLESRTFWSVGHEPAQSTGSEYEALWRPGRFQLSRVDEGIESFLEICVPSDAAAEVRKLSLRNRSGRRRRIELTTYLELVLDDASAFERHPAFSKLFVQTQFDRERSALLAHRRARAEGEHHPWMVHALIGADVLECETDRARFLGRGSQRRQPFALTSHTPLSGSVGNVLDPVFSLRSVIELEAGESKSVTLMLGAAPDRTQALALVQRFAQADEVVKAFEGAQAHERGQIERLGMSEREAEFFQIVAGAMLYGDPGLRAAPEVLQHARASDLVHLGLSPHRHLAVVYAENSQETALVPKLVRAHAYWQTLQLPIDLVVLSGEQLPDPEKTERLFRLHPRTVTPKLSSRCMHSLDWL